MSQLRCGAIDEYGRLQPFQGACALSHATFGRWLLALLCGMQGIGTLAIDLNRTHATNPVWLRHARFHLVWQAISYALLSVLEVALILAPGSFQEQRFYLAAILAVIPMLSCLAAALSCKFYGGALSDPSGIQPARVRLFSSEFHVDMNVAAEVLALTMLCLIVAFYRC
jgi:hypothetical protein